MAEQVACTGMFLWLGILFSNRQKRQALPNKRFLNNTLVSTLRHSYREERKRRDGSYRKYKQHMENRKYYKNQTEPNIGEENTAEMENIDYGEFDAAKYAETCTELYIRDSHRKHSRMRQNFVEKKYEGSSSDSDDSYTVEDKNEVEKEEKISRQRKRFDDFFLLTFTQSSPGFYVFALQVYYKHCGKRRNCL